MFFNFQIIEFNRELGLYKKKFTWLFCSFYCLLDFIQRALEKCFQWLLLNVLKHLRRWWKHYAAQWHKKCQYFPSTSLSQPPSPSIPSLQNYSSACYFNIMFWLQRMDFLRSNRCIYKKKKRSSSCLAAFASLCSMSRRFTQNYITIQTRFKPDLLF